MLAAMTTARPVPFRAGRQAAEHGLAAAELAEVMPPDFGSSAVLLADVSEYQPQVDAAYLSWSQAIVIRAMYGDAHDDAAWYGGERRAFMHASGARFLGIYQYIVVGQDITAQAKALVALLGKLEPGEKIIGDLEEGAGNQAARRDTWTRVLQDAYGDTPWIYSGENFAASTGLAPVDWVAAYGVVEPSPRHQLWQFTDAMTVPGIAGTVDCSVYHGTIDDLAAQAWQGPVTRWAYPAPGGLHVAKQTRSGYTLAWDPVTHDGAAPASWSVYTYQNGRLVDHQNSVPGTSASEYGPHGNGMPAGTYVTRVWANGGPAAPPGSDITVTLHG